jgi:hypothetical protein
MKKRVDFICDCGRNYERGEEERGQRRGGCGVGEEKKSRVEEGGNWLNVGLYSLWAFTRTEIA